MPSPWEGLTSRVSHNAEALLCISPRGLFRSKDPPSVSETQERWGGQEQGSASAAWPGRPDWGANGFHKAPPDLSLLPGTPGTPQQPHLSNHLPFPKSRRAWKFWQLLYVALFRLPRPPMTEPASLLQGGDGERTVINISTSCPPTLTRSPRLPPLCVHAMIYFLGAPKHISFSASESVVSQRCLVAHSSHFSRCLLSSSSMCKAEQRIYCVYRVGEREVINRVDV